MTNPKPAGTWDWDGACRPGRGLYRPETFSVGIFQWYPKANGKGTKRGKVVKRIKGRTTDAEAVYARARELCIALNQPDNLTVLLNLYGDKE